MKLLAPLATVAALSLAVFEPTLAASVVDETTVIDPAKADLIDTITAIGGMIIGAAVVAIAFKWAKGAIFG
jgi:uncharacterized protein (DUF2236 family)